MYFFLHVYTFCIIEIKVFDYILFHYNLHILIYNNNIKLINL